MNPREYLIIDTSLNSHYKKYITRQVAQIDDIDNKWHITFTNKPTVYKYRHERIKLLSHPESINIENKGLFLRNKRIENIKEVFCFKDNNRNYYHIILSNDYELDYDDSELYISRTTIKESGGTNWEYLNTLASETGLELENVGNILKMQYDTIDSYRDNIPLLQYLGSNEKLSTYSLPKLIIYPFGCNASQMASVEAALTNQLSIIQGPPGTGKTQTILNLIANLLLQKKSILVVSNNNSAIENIKEKLANPSIGLDFLVAQLGRKENKELFIANQPSYPEFTDWELENNSEIKTSINQIIQSIAKGFESQTQLAKLRLELEALETETKYNQIFSTEYGNKFHWLGNKKSNYLTTLKCEIETLADQNRRPRIGFYVKWLIRLGYRAFSLLRTDKSKTVHILESAYYVARKNELLNEINKCNAYLSSININDNIATLRLQSMQVLKHFIAEERSKKPRQNFKIGEIKSKSNEFISEYPIVLSTTYTARNCINKNMIFDYVIMDEASQIDIATGALALSCAKNAVIVGDDKQLPNVIDTKLRAALEAIEDTFGVDDKYRSSTHSFLQSCCKVFTDAPQTLLREHYRCHPKIIEFCNKMFYGGELIPMTTDSGEKNAISIIQTVKGNHARQHYNQREIDVIRDEVMPKLSATSSIGIITPYREQATTINSQLHSDIASTVHKYQGRECESIIMSTVDNNITNFSDNPNLLNVAISRAKSQLIVVTNGNEIDPTSNLGQLISYANYNNFNVSQSSLHSIFDILYSQYTQERLAYITNNKNNIDGELSEKLIYDMIEDYISANRLNNTRVLCHYPLSRLISKENTLTEEQIEFANDIRTHLDFIIYNTLTKQPLLALEVDGWNYHQTETQQKRDKLKDSILQTLNLQLLRLSTTALVTQETLSSHLKSII